MTTPGHSLRFIVALALGAVAVRVLLVDHLFFALREIPSHDFSQAIAFFATSMHSVFLSGDIAWWSPGGVTGYAQYFQGLFSPLAPTYGHLVFIAWAHLVGVLATLGIHVPEYMQFLVMTYVVLPFLAFAAFAFFCAQLLRTRRAVAFALMAYVLSGIGLWNSAWFFFQEAATLFFVLGTLLALLRRPTLPRALAFIAAALVQGASINYWTVYDIFFFAALVGFHAATHAAQWRRLGRWGAAAARRHRRGGLVVALGSLAVVVAWGAVLAATFLDEGSSQVRRVFTMDDAIDRIQGARRYTVELFNPVLARATQKYLTLNEIHNARYIGMLALPLLLVTLASPWTRRTRWLLGTALAMLAISAGLPYAVQAWAAIPFMDRIQHLFYFYSHFWQLMLVLLAALGLDRLLLRRPTALRAARFVSLGGLALAGLLLVGMFVASDHYPADDPGIQAVVLAGLLLAIACGLLHRFAGAAGERERRFAAAALLALAFVDLSLYFASGSRVDIAFTRKRHFIEMPIAPEAQAKLRAPWPAPDPKAGFRAGLDAALPIATHFWPVNVFMVPTAVGRAQVTEARKFVMDKEPFAFYAGATQAAQAALDRPAAQILGPLESRLVVADAVTAKDEADPSRVTAGFTSAMTQWGYNGFSMELTAPREGWLLVRQLHSKAWRYTVDGTVVPTTQANHISTALRVGPGVHRVRADYRPWPRLLYWPAALMLEIVVAALLLAAWRMRRRAAR